MRSRLVWIWRLVLLGFALVYLASAELQASVPPLLPFLCAAAVEAQFFLAGLRAGGPRAPVPDRGPQARDIDELGWASRIVTVDQGEAELVLRPGEMEREEIADWLEQHREELAALGPGHHELAAIETPESPLSLYVPAPTSGHAVARAHAFYRRSRCWRCWRDCSCSTPRRCTGRTCLPPPAAQPSPC